MLILNLKSTRLHPDLPDVYIQAFIGPNHRYFLYKWKFASMLGQWNWAAFFLGPFWFIYRRHYILSMMFTGLYLISDLIFTTNPYHFSFILEWMLLSGLFANRLHLATFKNTLNHLVNQHPDETTRIQQLRQHGGIDWSSPLILFFCMLSVTLLAPSFFGIHLLSTRVIRADLQSIGYTFIKPDTLWKEFDLLRKDYQRAYLEGFFDRCITLNENTLKLSEYKHGKDHPYTIALQSELIMYKLKAGYYKDTYRLTEELLQIYQVRFGKNHLFMAFMQNNLVSIFLYQGLYNQAKTEANNCMLILEQYHENFTEPVLLYHLATIYSNMGFIYQAYCQYDLAEKYHTEALQFALQSCHGNMLQVCSFLERLGDFYVEQLKLPEAEKHYLQVRTITEEALGSDNPLASSIYLKLGELAFIKQQYSRALDLAKKAQALNETYYGYQHTATAASANLLGRIYYSQGNLYESEIYLYKSLSITEKAIGMQNALYAKYAYQIAEIYLFRNDFIDAETNLLNSVQTLTTIYGAGSPHLLSPLEDLVILYEKSHNFPAKQTYIHQIQQLLHNSPVQPPSRKYFNLNPENLMI